MSEQKFSLTPEQAEAVTYRGGALLVSAAAGSGKTKTLVGRLLSRVAGGEDNIDEFLVITYTRAAASELREKILDEISIRLADEPENRHLRRQSMLCRGAPIGTIHAFCTDVLRENAHLAGLTPDFRVADESESAIIKSEVLEHVLDKAYETIGTSGVFRELVDVMSAGRDDARLVNIILDAHAKLQSSPNPRAWVSEQALRSSMSGITDVSETIWGAQLMEKARRTTEFWLDEIMRSKECSRSCDELNKSYGTSLDATIASMSSFLNALDSGWDEARRHSRIDFPRPKPLSGYEGFKDIRKRCKAAMDKCSRIFECSSSELIEDMLAVEPAVTALLELILEFDRAYSEEKRRRGTVDFSDLEHMALSLLIDEETGEKTGLARTISLRYREIMVDEYQDVNAVQELIFNAVSRDGGNIFMVGDVKQSIYRFRLADPSIFLEKYRSFASAGDNPDGGARILLSKNFRSRAGILDAVNFIFGSIMSVEFGEMDYTESESLIPGRTDDECTDPAVELDIIDMSAAARGDYDNGDEDGDEAESPVKAQVEARFIAEQITELAGKYMISDGRGGSRPAEYSDIVILLRSIRDKAWQYAAALTEYGIPVDLPGSEGFFETPEISYALSLLSVIDNPMQDIPLAAALRGPVYGFSADELAAIRIGARDKTDFYGALVKSAETDEKCAAFLNDLDSLRELSPDMPADRFVWHVYNRTGMLGRFGAMLGGVRRRGNLMLLVECARRFEQSGYKGLFGFLTYMRGLRERGAEPAISADAAAPVQNAVRIMSIHKSKGLEFPVVFLADTSKRLNNRDAQKPVVIHPRLGVGATLTDRRRRIEYPTLARLAIQSRLKSEMMAEELRVLYVAMTRAREKLIITAALADAGRELEKLSKYSCANIPAQALEDAKSMAEWILLPALNRPEAAFLTDGPVREERRDEWDVRLIEAAEKSQIRARPGEPGSEGPVGAAEGMPGEDGAERDEGCNEYVEVLRKRFSFVYPHACAPDLPSKLTVTEFKGRYFDYETSEEAEKTELLEPTSARKGRFAFERPDFIAGRTFLTAAERGTALHLAMQYIDFEKATDAEGVRDELRRLVDMGFIAQAQADAVDVHKITGFFGSDIGMRVLGAENVRREFKFSLLYPAGRFYPGGGEDKMLLQGVVDCFFEEHGALVVVDFKTDRVTADTLGERAKIYAPQLAAYADALERITGMRVKSRVIYFFDIGAAVEV